MLIANVIVKSPPLNAGGCAAEFMIALMNARFGGLQSVFGKLGIVSLVPGFYDDPAFLEAERLMPTLLDVYAEYCVLAAATEDQTKNEEKILRVVSFLSPLITA
jgi:hypothetical protein